MGLVLKVWATLPASVLQTLSLLKSFIFPRSSELSLVTLHATLRQELRAVGLLACLFLSLLVVGIEARNLWKSGKPALTDGHMGTLASLSFRAQ